MAGITARMASAGLTRSASASSDTVHGVAGLAVGEESCVVEDTGVLKTEVLTAHADGSAELAVARNRGKNPTRPPTPVPGRSSAPPLDDWNS